MGQAQYIQFYTNFFLVINPMKKEVPVYSLSMPFNSPLSMREGVIFILLVRNLLLREKPGYLVQCRPGIQCNN